MHALVEPGIKQAVGIEVDEIKCMKSESVIHEACKKLQSLGLTVAQIPLVIHRDIERVRNKACRASMCFLLKCAVTNASCLTGRTCASSIVQHAG